MKNHLRLEARLPKKVRSSKFERVFLVEGMPGETRWEGLDLLIMEEIICFFLGNKII